MSTYIRSHRDEFGVEPICHALQVAPSSYYAAINRQPSKRDRDDAELRVRLKAIHDENFEVYGVRKMWRQARRESLPAGRDRVARLMRDLGIRGAARERRRRTTIPGEPAAARPADLVDREFTAPAPNRLWVADLTYVATWSGFAYVAFVVDAYSRRIVGWRVSNSLRTDLALDALEMAIWARQGAPLDQLVHHSDRGVQYLAIRYTERLEEAGAVRSVGSRGDSYDNALAESVNALYKAELIRRRGPWKTVEAVEHATLQWVDWYNRRRLHSACGDIPPAEFEDLYYSDKNAESAA